MYVFFYKLSIYFKEVLKFQELLVKTEEWLYEDGEAATKEIYTDKLYELRQVIETPIDARQKELAAKKKEAAEVAAAAAAPPDNAEEKMNVDDTNQNGSGSTAV